MPVDLKVHGRCQRHFYIAEIFFRMVRTFFFCQGKMKELKWMEFLGNSLSSSCHQKYLFPQASPLSSRLSTSNPSVFAMPAPDKLPNLLLTFYYWEKHLTSLSGTSGAPVKLQFLFQFRPTSPIMKTQLSVIKYSAWCTVMQYNDRDMNQMSERWVKTM